MESLREFSDSHVYVYGYEFDILGKKEIHTEVRVFGNDYWYEKYGVQQQPETDIKPGFDRVKTILIGPTQKTQPEFDQFLASILPDFQPQQYLLFKNNCRTYSAKLIGFLFPSSTDAIEAKTYLYFKQSEATLKSSVINTVGSALYSYGKSWYDSRSQSSTGDNNRSWREPNTSNGPSAPTTEEINSNANPDNTQKPATTSDYIEFGVQLFSALGRKGAK